MTAARRVGAMLAANTARYFRTIGADARCILPGFRRRPF